LDGLSEVLDRKPATRLVVVGDFNQRIQQGKSAPADVRMALKDAIGSRMNIVTSGLGYRGRRSIDHVALSNDLSAEYLGVISNFDGERKLSDHFGVVGGLSAERVSGRR
jgi:endonuclease/exonuclease/phosphatase family metal-dependent hydrolase